MLEEALFAYLSADTTLLALVGQGSLVRVFPHVIPQKRPAVEQMPCVVYSVTGEVRGRTLCGVDGLVQATVQIDCHGKTLRSAREVSAAVRPLMVDYRGAMGDLVVRDVSLDTSVTLNDMEPGLMRVLDSYTVWYEEE